MFSTPIKFQCFITSILPLQVVSTSATSSSQSPRLQVRLLLNTEHMVCTVWDLFIWHHHQAGKIVSLILFEHQLCLPQPWQCLPMCLTQEFHLTTLLNILNRTAPTTNPREKPLATFLQPCHFLWNRALASSQFLCSSPSLPNSRSISYGVFVAG